MEDGVLTVHGGAMLMAMDRCAADLCRLTLYSSESSDPDYGPPRTALTVGVEKVEFHSGALLGDLIFIEAEIIKLGVKRMEVQVDCYISHSDRQVHMCCGTFIFCSVHKPGKSLPHGLRLNNGNH